MSDGRIVSVIDVGSNSVRLLVARELSPTAFEVIDEERFDARLAAGQRDGVLAEEGIARGLLALRAVSQVSASYRPWSTVAVGTEALRRATNADSFLGEARARTGLDVRVLSVEDEAFASFLGTVNSTSLRTGPIVDIGGGSLELIDVSERAFGAARSAPLGAIYATERFFGSGTPSRRDVRALRKAVRQQLGPTGSAEALYGVGGAIRNLARIVRLKRAYPLRRLHGLVIERREVRRLAAALVSASPDARRRIAGVSPARADILPAAAVVIDEVMEMTGAAVLCVSGQGLREGLLWQEIRGAEVIPDVRAASIQGLARANGIDERAAEPVVSAATALFEATAPLHGLGAPELDLLGAAARLASVGVHVDYYNRDRHAEYLVHSGDLHGFTHREIVLLGALVRAADSRTPDLSLYRPVSDPEDARRAAVLAAILGMARAVRRRPDSPVSRVKATLKAGQLTLTLGGSGSLEAERVAIERQQRRFESTLRVTLKVSVSR